MKKIDEAVKMKDHEQSKMDTTIITSKNPTHILNNKMFSDI